MTASENAEAERDQAPDQEPAAETLDRLVAAALPHVAFDGWSGKTLDAAIAEAGVSPGAARLAAPRGGVDLAAAFHRQGDRTMAERAATLDLEALRYSERVARLVRLRIEVVAGEREAVRRGVTLFSLPGHAAEGARLIWGTADAIWTALGDTSTDYNWHTKRAILSGVYGSVVLYWLGDQSDGAEATWAFLDRRIGDVMRFEKTKAKLRGNPLARAAFAGPKAILERFAPGAKSGAGMGAKTPPFGAPGQGG